MTDETRQGFWDIACSGTATDRRNKRRMRAWLLSWMGSWLAIIMALRFDWLPQGLLATTLTILSAVLGLFALAAYRRFLLEADELHRKIQLEALAAAVGIGVLGGLTAWLLVLTGALESFDGLWIIVAMLFSHGIGVFIGQRRYS